MKQIFISTLSSVLAGVILYLLFLTFIDRAELGSNILPTKAVLTPAHNFFKNELKIVDGTYAPNDSFEIVFPQLYVKNLNNKPVLITAAEVIPLNMTQGDAVTISNTVSTDNILKNNTILIPPGETMKIDPGTSLKFNGLAEILQNPPFHDVIISKVDDYVTLHNGYFTPLLNDVFTNTYGPNAGFRIILYTGKKQELKEIDFFLNRGTNMFIVDGQIEHDYFLKNAFIQIVKPFNSPEYQ